MRYFVTFSYLGTDFHGSQTQPHGQTVQSVMEEAFATILRVPTPLTFAGRTDAGVHAEMMVAHFDSLTPIPTNLGPRLNSLLPATIAIRDIRRVTDDAHARFDAIERTYRYRITTRKDPFCYHTRTRIASPLDFDAINDAANHLLGTQDFNSFCRTHTDVKTTICTVTDALWIVENEYESYFSISANRFLRNMVRAIVGTLFEVGRGRMTEDEFADVINAHDRRNAGHSAPAEGLALVDIKYPNHITNHED
jgi:tRNA pseudouridine38-40 synthase